jgi:hypothetical protein
MSDIADNKIDVDAQVFVHTHGEVHKCQLILRYHTRKGDMSPSWIEPPKKTAPQRV